MNNKIKILEIVPNMQQGGLENLVMNILRYIDKLELDVCLIEGINKDHIGTAIENRLIRACEYNIL